MVQLPIRTVSEANVRTHWAARARRARDQRSTVAIALRCHGVTVATLPCVVALTRIAPRELDDDNLRGALKAVRDGIADALEVDDRDARVRWEYGQRRGAANEHSVDIEIQAMGMVEVRNGIRE